MATLPLPPRPRGGTPTDYWGRRVKRYVFAGLGTGCSRRAVNLGDRESELNLPPGGDRYRGAMGLPAAVKA